MDKNLALETLKSFVKNTDNVIAKDAILALHPELAESEDERVRKELHNIIRRSINDPNLPYEKRLYISKSVLPYIENLEKQKEQKTTPDWMPKFLDELRSMNHYFDWDEHRYIEGRILAIINWIAPDYFDRKEKGQKQDTRDADDLQLLGFIYDLLASLDWRENYAMSKEECLRRLNDYRP